MTEADFIETIKANPDDDGPRLVLADWYEERGDSKGELIRIQCQLQNGPISGGLADIAETATKLKQREAELIKALEGDSRSKPPLARGISVGQTFMTNDGDDFTNWLWNGQMWIITAKSEVCRYIWRRGFIDEMFCPNVDYIDKLWPKMPLLRRVALTERPERIDFDGNCRFEVDSKEGIRRYENMDSETLGSFLRSQSTWPAIEKFSISNISRWPGLTIVVPERRAYGSVVTLPPDFLTHDYTNEMMAQAREAGDRWAREENRRIMDAFLSSESLRQAAEEFGRHASNDQADAFRLAFSYLSQGVPVIDSRTTIRPSTD